MTCERCGRVIDPRSAYAAFVHYRADCPEKNVPCIELPEGMRQSCAELARELGERLAASIAASVAAQIEVERMQRIERGILEASLEIIKFPYTWERRHATEEGKEQSDHQQKH